MPISLDQSMMRAIIMEHYENPHNRFEVFDPAYQTVHLDSASCIDDIYVQVKIVDERIADLKWHGTGCAISTAATSIMSEVVKEKNRVEVLELYRNYQNMLEGKAYDYRLLGEANAFANTGRQPSRISCATIGWRGLLLALGLEVKDAR